jgi:hypothetical protein
MEIFTGVKRRYAVANEKPAGCAAVQTLARGSQVLLAKSTGCWSQDIPSHSDKV